MTSSSAAIRLYSGPLSMFGAKAQIAILEKDLPHELVMVPFDMERLYQPRHPEVARINPKEQVPVLVHGEVEIYDSTQIFEYLEDLAPRPPLWPADRAGRAWARRLELEADEVYFPHVIRLMGLQQTPEHPHAVAAREGAARFHDRFERVLGENEFLADRYSCADIAFYMAQLFGARMGAPMTEATPRLLQWRDRVSSRAAVREVAGAMARYLLSVGRALPDFMSALAVG